LRLHAHPLPADGFARGFRAPILNDVFKFPFHLALLMSSKDLVNTVGTQSEGNTAFDVVVFHVPVDQDPAHSRQRFQSLNGSRPKEDLSARTQPFAASVPTDRIMVRPQLLLLHPKLHAARLGKRLLSRIPYASRGVRPSVRSRLKRFGAPRTGILEYGLLGAVVLLQSGYRNSQGVSVSRHTVLR
jgi:hypothetical protein